MPKQGKNYRQAAQQVEPRKEYAPLEAMELLVKTKFAKFDETVDVHMRLGIDPRHADQQVRGVVLLPHGVGKQVRILVFAEGEAAKIASDAGADFVGTDELIARIQEGWVDFDATIAVPQVMGKVGRLGRVLGPRGLMPSPKADTIVQQEDLPRLINELRLGRVEFRVDKTANMHVPIGKASFSPDKLVDNLASLMDAVVRARPGSVKGQYIRRITVTSTMGPGIHLDVQQTSALKPII
jgi:large subunit ribosomal protein L1